MCSGGGRNPTAIMKVVMLLAWISVHDHVDGGKLRELAKEIGCSKKEALGILVSLWLWGLNNADRTGKLRSCDKNDVAEEVSKGISRGLEPHSIVDNLINQHWIDEEEDGSLYLHDWDVWQEQWYKFLSAKEYDAERKRKERARKKAEAQRSEETENMASPPDNPKDSPLDSPPDNPPDKLKKPKKPAKKKPEKKQYAEYVSLTEDEYGKLVYGYGQRAADKFVEVLNLYKGSTGKTYKSDYMTILNWVISKVERENPGMIQRPSPEVPVSDNQPESSNPFEQWKE